MLTTPAPARTPAPTPTRASVVRRTTLGLGSLKSASSSHDARDGLLLMHRDALYEGGAPSPLQLSWSDASCSTRFYDYGSARMAQEVARVAAHLGLHRSEEEMRRVHAWQKATTDLRGKFSRHPGGKPKEEEEEN